jgi:hypothetical protein
MLQALAQWIAAGLDFFTDAGAIWWGLWDYVVAGVQG